MAFKNTLKAILSCHIWLVTVVWVTLAGVPAQAHSINQSYVYFDVTDTTLSGRVEVRLEELAKIVRPETGTVPLTRDEVIASYPTLKTYFEERMTLFWEERRYDVAFDGVDFLDTEAGTFAQLGFEVLDVGLTPLTIEMSYDAMFAEVDSGHRGYALIGSNTRTSMGENESYISLAFLPGDGRQQLFLNDEPTLQVALTFLEHGVWHIWLGFDHVLFLIALLIPAVMFVDQGRWSPAGGLRQSLMTTVKIVTVFTLAHTVTLSLATFNILTLPVVLVEAVIAISIAIVAFGTLFPRFHTQSWIIVFAFGLFHGFGFANVLEPLGLDPARKAVGLAAFNIGVELGQLAIVLAVFPILFALRHYRAYQFVSLQAGSVALIAVALFWFVERTQHLFVPATLVVSGG
ncbi:MAG: HupE/UreJ family protein [Tateyamaria sp.]|jgi:hypothetical protein|uniref:HupE/UreJ family protein n=1 Tax=unclassified Tateyamaria TaxID=2645127 RepID=UPI000D54CE53|nr:HupE/UreJ family protein [Tateyamaria sp. Alg231-49]